VGTSAGQRLSCKGFLRLWRWIPKRSKHGLKHSSYINCDQLVRIEKNRLTDFVGSLPASKIKALNQSLRIALDLE
jgi:mRNA-degrading endonuclease toxin of MazEF toxin-antitoxin module